MRFSTWCEPGIWDDHAVEDSIERLLIGYAWIHRVVICFVIEETSGGLRQKLCADKYETILRLYLELITDNIDWFKKYLYMGKDAKGRGLERARVDGAPLNGAKYSALNRKYTWVVYNLVSGSVVWLLLGWVCKGAELLLLGVLQFSWSWKISILLAEGE